uniref:Uncharacterized protein n=1 Tax=Rhizophagus irregularis (strain DAOM 181602 / DAOM 197198 / MUCL 43194) TaxID=747089 RepID=U9TI28_RHIID
MENQNLHLVTLVKVTYIVEKDIQFLNIIGHGLRYENAITDNELLEKFGIIQ